jgi:arginine decarboxylase
MIDQAFDFPQAEVKLSPEGNLLFHDIDLMKLIEEHGAPLKFHYLPQISSNIKRAKGWFKKAFKKHNFKTKYHYCYCTKSSHFSFVLKEALKNDIHIETSSSYDIDLVNELIKSGDLKKSQYIVCNGFKTDAYIDNIANLINSGHKNVIPVLDNFRELPPLQGKINDNFEVGIRIASEEEPKFEFYTSRLGIGYLDIKDFVEEQIMPNPSIGLKLLHFFINTGIKDTAYYWNELRKCLKVYTDLKQICPELDTLNIGGGFPIKAGMNFTYDYEYMVDEICYQVKQHCEEAGVDIPNIMTEFGSFTVGESGGTIFSILYQKQQNDKEKWNMIDSSFMTSLPDTWAISKRFLMLPINRWHEEYERVLLGGLSCDSDDYYNSEQHVNAIFLPVFNVRKPLYIGFFNTGAYQENVGGFGGLQHCMIPSLKHLVIEKDENGEFVTKVFAQEQTARQMLTLLGYP